MKKKLTQRENTKSWINSLGGKFVIPIVLILTITLGASAIYKYRIDKNSAYSSLYKKINNLSDFVVSISPNAILSFDFNSLNNYMKNLTQSEDIVYAVITSPEGKAMTSYMDNQSQYILDKNPTSNSMIKTNNYEIFDLLNEINKHPDIIKISYPISFENLNLGTINIGVSNKRIEDNTRRLLYQQLIVNLSIITLLCALIYNIFRVSTLRPITQLIDGSVRLANGNLNEKVIVYSNDELGVLAKCFNNMMNNLKQSNHEKDDVLNELKDLNKNLENRVKQRTAELIDVNKELEYLALHDTLTGLPNRSVIQDSLKHNIYFSKSENQQFCIFMMDLDRFKEVNDTLGHDFGDRLLVEVSQRLANSLRENDIIGRLGGDEFAIILPKTQIEEAILISNIIRKEIEPAFFILDHALSISVSIGISCYPQHGNDASTLMKAADVAMYHSKNGKLGHCIFNESLNNSNPNQLNIMGELRSAIKNEDLCLYYQPKVDTKTQRIIGVEALVRWKHETRGLIFPDEFIPLAEQTGLIKSLTNLVLKLAMQQAALWNEQHINISMAVNLSMHDIQNEDFPNILSDMMAQYQLDQGQLMLEITESTIMSNPVNVMLVLNKIAEMGVKLSIDDFGTGYSSLSNLKKMPVHELKIDRSFVMDMMQDKDDLAIVESTIFLAHSMGLKVVAEGVETNEISTRLVELGCDIIQGYYISKPVPADEITKILTQSTLPNAINKISKSL